MDHKLFTGGWGSGGEVGHMTVEANGPKCACGNIGCLEMMAAGPAIARRARERLMAGESSLILELVRGDLDAITAKEVNEAGQQGDPVAREIFAEAGRYIGAGIVNLIYLLDPGLFVLGGSVTQAGDLLFVPLRETVAQRAPAFYQEYSKIVPAVLGADVGLWGALALALMETNQ
jgi:glucokinase